MDQDPYFDNVPKIPDIPESRTGNIDLQDLRFAFAFIRIHTPCRAGMLRRGVTEVGGSEGRGLEYHALYINMGIDKPSRKANSHLPEYTRTCQDGLEVHKL